MTKETHGYKYLIKNIGFLTLGQFATKLISFFLVPLYTSVLTTSEYGTYDLFITTISVLIPILTVNIQEAVIRFALDKKTDLHSIVSISFRYLIISNFIVAVGIIINCMFNFFPTLNDYSVLFIFLFFTQTLSGIMTAYARGIDKVADLSISGVLGATITIVANLIFLLLLKWGIRGYFIANIIGPLVQSIYIIIRTCYLREISFKRYLKEKKEMVSYSRPLIANSIAWWVTGVSDKYVVTFFCGLSENGIYSVAGKIPQILNIFQTIFSQAWTLSVVKDFDAEDKNGFFSNTYRIYNCSLVLLCSLIITFDKLLAKLLYANEFYFAWKYVPWLTIAIVFGSLSGYIGGFFSAVKDSRIFATSTVWGAVTNVILNLIFTPICGAMGAAIATAICYLEVWIFRYYQSKKYIKLNINLFRDIMSYCLLVAQSVILLISNGYLAFLLLFLIFVMMCILYRSDIILIVSLILKHKRN